MVLGDDYDINGCCIPRQKLKASWIALGTSLEKESNRGQGACNALRCILVRISFDNKDRDGDQAT